MVVVVIDAHALDEGNIAAKLLEAAGTRGVPNYIFLVLPQDGSFNFLRVATGKSKMIHIPQHLLLNVLVKRAGKKLYRPASASGTPRT